MDYNEYIKNNIIRLDYSRRGGGIEIDVSEFIGIEDARMTAYQNYLGGGLLGAVQSDINYTLETQQQEESTNKMREALKRYFHNLTNAEAGDRDDFNSMDYEQNQSMPHSAF